MQVTLRRGIDRNQVEIEFSGRFELEDLAVGFPCADPHDPANDALYKDLIAACLADDDQSPDTLARRAEVIGRTARAIADALRAVDLNAEVIGPNPQA